jgi:hypothetical protein
MPRTEPGGNSGAPVGGEKAYEKCGTSKKETPARRWVRALPGWQERKPEKPESPTLANTSPRSKGARFICSAYNRSAVATTQADCVRF